MIIKITQESVIRRNKVRSRNSEFRIRIQETGVGTVEKAFGEGERVLSQRRKGAKGGSGSVRVLIIIYLSLRPWRSWRENKDKLAFRLGFFMLFMVIKNRGKKIELSISNPKDAARRFS